VEGWRRNIRSWLYGFRDGDGANNRKKKKKKKKSDEIIRHPPFASERKADRYKLIIDYLLNCADLDSEKYRLVYLLVFRHCL